MLDRCTHTAEGMGERLTDTYRVADLIRARDVEVRADEHGGNAEPFNVAKTDKELERLREFAKWVVNLEKIEFIEERRTVTLTKIIDRAAKALGHVEEQPNDS